MRDELSLLQAQLTYKKRLESVLAELRSQYTPLKAKTDALEQTMLREKSDVDRLEGRSLAAFFYHAVGKMDEKLKGERREYYAARVKYDACRRELDAIAQDIESTEEDLADLVNCEARYAQALEEKRRAIEDSALPEAAALLQQEEALAALSGQEQEVLEAIDAGTQALRATAEVMQRIEDAKDWATIDLWGGGLFSDLAKHEKLDEAQALIEGLQIQLQKFNKELSDVEIRAHLQVSIDGMLRFADFFFDGILADAAVLDRIKHSLTQVTHTREEILHILRTLQEELETLRGRKQKLQREVDTLVLNVTL